MGVIMHVLALGCCNKAPEAHKQQQFISNRSGAWESELRVPAWLGAGESTALDCGLPTFHRVLAWPREEQRKEVLCDSYMGISSIHDHP